MVENPEIREPVIYSQGTVNFSLCNHVFELHYKAQLVRVSLHTSRGVSVSGHFSDRTWRGGDEIPRSRACFVRLFPCRPCCS